MWIAFAFGSALFAGLTAILAKCGIKNTDSNVATALRTIVVLCFAWLMVFVQGSWQGMARLEWETLLFLILSGVATGASWLCYFRALQIGDINKVTPVDKMSTVLTMLLAFFLLKEPITPVKALAMAAIGAGTYLMIQKKAQAAAVRSDEGGGQSVESGSLEEEQSDAGGKPGRPENTWLLYAAGSAIFASLTSILGKIGIQGIDSTLGTAIRTIVVLIMAWVVVFVSGKQHTIRGIDKKSRLFLILSGFATGGSWLCYYRALQEGPASVVVPIDKLSILVTVAFSYFVFGERLSRKAAGGLALITAGTLALLL